MRGSERYLLDATVFIESAKKYYAFDLTPGFWNNLLRYGQEKKVFSIDKINDQILKGNEALLKKENIGLLKKNELIDWVTNKFDFAFLPSEDDDVNNIYRKLMNWAFSTRYTDRAKREFAETENADAWLIAYSKAKEFILVTDEQLVTDPNIKKKIYIPNVCQEFDIECINTFEMLRRLNIKMH